MIAPVDVLAIAAHPDDAEVGCAGALLVSAAQGLRVAVVDLTRGEHSTLGTPERREEERRRATEVLALSERRHLDLPDAAVGTAPEHRDVLVDLLRELRPRLLLAPHTEDRHPDHAAAGRLAREAAYLAGVGRLRAGRPHRPERIYHYAMHHPIDASFVLDVSAVWERRMEAMAAYESQFGPRADADGTEIAQAAFLEMINARARFYGSMVGVTHGEPYRCVGPLWSGALPGLERARPERRQPYRSFL
jgi:N-acetylglucosamine malate deacetylase 1